MTADALMDPYDISEIHDLFRPRFPERQRQPAFPGMHPFPTPQSPTIVPSMSLAIPLGVRQDLTRYWFLDESGANIVQLQENFTARNWRRWPSTEGQAHPYPGFDSLMNDFISHIDHLGRWHNLNGRAVAPPAVCELLYDNLIPMTQPDGEMLRIGDVATCVVPQGRVAAGFAMQWYERITEFDDATQPMDFQVMLQSLSWQSPFDASVLPYLKLMFVARSAQQAWKGVYDFLERAHSHVRSRLLDLTSDRIRSDWSGS